MSISCAMKIELFMFNITNYIVKIDRLKAPVDKELAADYKRYRIFNITNNLLGIIILALIIYFFIYVYKTGHENTPWWFFLLGFPYMILDSVSRKYEESVDILTAKKERLDRATEYIMEINRLLSLQKPYVLYLRDFYSGSLEKQEPVNGASFSGIANPVNWPTNYGKKTTPMSLHYFNERYPVVLLNNDLEKTLLKGGLYIYPDDSNWFEDFKKLAAGATFTIIDYDYDSITQNIFTEIDSLILTGKKNLIFIGTKEDRISVDQRFPKLAELVLCNCYIETTREGLNKYTKINFEELNSYL